MYKPAVTFAAATSLLALTISAVLAAPATKTTGKTTAKTTAPTGKATAPKPQAGNAARNKRPVIKKPATVSPGASPTPQPAAPTPAGTLEPASPTEMMGIPPGMEMPPGMGMPGEMPGMPASPVDRLFRQGVSNDEFQKALLEARAANAPAQLILEAQLIRNARMGENDTLIAMIPEVEKAIPTFDAETSRLISSKQSLEAFLMGLRALEAGDKDDAATFERLIKDAFWKAPEFGLLFSQWTSEFQEDQATAKLTIPLDVPLASADGSTQTLKQIMGNNKALLVDLWATWCPQCLMAMPNLPPKARSLAKQGVAFAGLNVGPKDTPQVVAIVKQRANVDFPMLIEPAERQYSKVVDTGMLPRMLLIAADGRLLYNGHPENPKLKRILKKLGAEM